MSTEPTVYTPQHLAPAPVQTPAPVVVQAAPVVLPQQPLTVAYVPGPQGQMMAAYVPAPVVEQPRDRPGPAAHPLLVNAALGAAAFAGIGIGLHFLAEFITALVHLLWALVVLAGIVCGAPVALQLVRALGGGNRQTQTINARKVIVRRWTQGGGN